MKHITISKDGEYVNDFLCENYDTEGYVLVNDMEIYFSPEEYDITVEDIPEQIETEEIEEPIDNEGEDIIE